jgi:hypothetical protein
VGFNFQPLLANSYEFIGEYNLLDALAISGKIGYAGKAPFLRLNNSKLGKIDIQEINTSGCFAKLGLKYLFKNRLFVLANVMVSQSKNDVVYAPLDSVGIFIHEKYSEVSLGGGIASGYRAPIVKDHLYFDMGFQLMYNFNSSRVGSGYYVPGCGSLLTYYPVYIQGLMGLMVVL